MEVLAASAHPFANQEPFASLIGNPPPRGSTRYNLIKKAARIIDGYATMSLAPGPRPIGILHKSLRELCYFGSKGSVFVGAYDPWDPGDPVNMAEVATKRLFQAIILVEEDQTVDSPEHWLDLPFAGVFKEAERGAERVEREAASCEPVREAVARRSEPVLVGYDIEVDGYLDAMKTLGDACKAALDVREAPAHACRRLFTGYVRPYWLYLQPEHSGQIMQVRFASTTPTHRPA
jgi:hypothetical protein